MDGEARAALREWQRDSWDHELNDPPAYREGAALAQCPARIIPVLIAARDTVPNTRYALLAGFVYGRNRWVRPRLFWNTGPRWWES